MSENLRGLKAWGHLLSEGRLPRFALICLGVWLNAVDTLVTATIMPSVGADLGGLAYFSWATAGFLIGCILAGASAGRLSEIFGLRLATTIGGLAFAAGCLVSAAAPDIATFLVGRVIQGVGSGWISGFAMVSIALLFPAHHLARVFACVTSIWGVATVLGPLVGGLFASLGDWRAVFWLFAAQAAVFCLAAPWLLKGVESTRNGSGVPWAQLLILALGVGAIAAADVWPVAWIAVGLVALGFALLFAVLKLDDRARVRLLPHRAGDLTTVVGSGYAAQFALTAAAMSFTVYIPALLQKLHGLTPLWAGYVVGAQALAWTLAAVSVSGSPPGRETVLIRTGSVLIVLGVALLALLTRAGPLALIVAAAALMGGGFGLSSSFIMRRVMGALAEEDRAIGSSAIMAVRQTGGAAGAAMAGVVANLCGFGAGVTLAAAQASAVWIFVAALPMGVLGLLAAWRFTGSAVRA